MSDDNSVPNGTITLGQIWTVAQWNAAWQSKVDEDGGIIHGPIIVGGTQSAPAITNPAIAGGTQASPTISSPTITTPAITGGTFSAPAITGAATLSGVPFAPSATTDTTNASNISAGTLSGSRVAQINLAASGNGGVTGILPLANWNLSGSPTWTGLHTFSAGLNATTGAFSASLTIGGAAVAILASPDFTGTPTIAGTPIPTFLLTAAETAASVTPSAFQYPVGHPWRYGAKDDGATNCNTALQNWINVGQQGVPLSFPAVLCGGGYLITTALSITAGVNIQGGGWERSALLCSGCDGFRIAAGVAQVIMQNFRMNMTVRYQAPGGTVTPNSFAGIRNLGVAGTQNTEHLYRDLFIDGFGTYIVGGGLDFSLIDNCQGYFGLQGIILTGISADVTIRGGIYQCGNLNPSPAMIALQPSGVQVGSGGAGDDSQGCAILGVTITGFFADVWLFGAAFCSVIDSQLDFANGYNVLSQNGVLASCCHNIGNNYMAVTANGIHGIRLANNVVTSFTGGSRIHGNSIIEYAAGASRGISVDGTQEQNDIITGNTVNVGSVADLFISADAGTTSHVVTGNNFQGLGPDITVPCTYTGNKGAYVTAPTTFALTPLYSAVQATLTYSASMTPNFQTNNSLLIIATNATAFTINNAINPPAAGGLKARIWILNASGGAIGAVTWGAAFKVPGSISYPANGFRRCYEFELAQAGGSYYLVNSPTVDIPN